MEQILAEYNLTDSQKEILTWLVEQNKAGNLEEEFIFQWYMGGYNISGFSGDVSNVPDFQNKKASLDSLAMEDFIYVKINFNTTNRGHSYESSRTCMLMQKAILAVENNFSYEDKNNQSINIGAVINEMSGGNLQAVGLAKDTTMSQIVNDPELLKSTIETITEKILSEVSPNLKAEQLVSYTQAILDLKKEIIKSQPNESKIFELIKMIGFFGNVEGTIALVTRVWPILQPLLLLIMSKLSA